MIISLNFTSPVRQSISTTVTTLPKHEYFVPSVKAPCQRCCRSSFSLKAFLTVLFHFCT